MTQGWKKKQLFSQLYQSPHEETVATFNIGTPKNGDQIALNWIELLYQFSYKFFM
jgi:hypothetical protein